MSLLPPEVPGPNPGQPGHFGHHDWLTASVKALDDATDLTAVLVPTTVTYTPGVATWAKPAGLVYAVVECQGGGGGGGGSQASASGQAAAAGAGGGGGYSRKVWKAADLLASEPLTIGAAGVGGNGMNAGGAGGTTAFKTQSATGGNGGQFSGSATSAGISGGGSGSGVGGDVNVRGDEGGSARIVPSTPVTYTPSPGGGSFLGGATMAIGGTGDGRTGLAYGGGGSGAGSRNGNPAGRGGNGAIGCLVITSYVLTYVTSAPRP